MSFLRLDGITKSFPARSGPPTLAIGGVDLAVRQGEFMAVVGPSGCGKSTLLQIAAGLIAPSGGSTRLAGTPIAGPPDGLVYVFQQYSRSLLPWRTVIDNVAFAIEHRPGISARLAREKAREQLAAVGLDGFDSHFPWQLSGGMQQRVAIARALTAEPKILLLDEPFSAVDALTRMDLQALLLEIWAQRGLTALLVTHDVDEAVYLADRIAVLTHRPSRISEVIEVGLPRPRDPIATREMPRFLGLRRELLDLLLRRPADAL
jgi:NitT/TauT family transport system ATP-binding protein